MNELTDTVAISPRCSAYGRHAARAADLPKLRPATLLRTGAVEIDAAVPEADANAPPPGERTTSRRLTALASYLRPRTLRRSA